MSSLLPSAPVLELFTLLLSNQVCKNKTQIWRKRNLFQEKHSDSNRLIASDFYKIDANLKKNYVNLSKNDQSSYYWKWGVTLACICGAD